MIHIRAKHLKNVQVWIGSKVKGNYSVIVTFPDQDYIVTYIPRFPDQTPHSAKSDLDLDCLSISHGCIYSYFDLFIEQDVFVPRGYTYTYEV